MPKATTPEIHAQTAAEIGRLAAEFRRERDEKIEQRQQIFQQRKAGASPSVMPADEVAARQFALDRLNGGAPAYMQEWLLQTDDPDHQLATQIRGLDLCLSVLGRQDTLLRAAQAYERADEWRQICHDYILTAERLLAIEERAAAWRRNVGLHNTPESLPLARFVGLGSLFDKRASPDPIARAGCRIERKDCNARRNSRSTR